MLIYFFSLHEIFLLFVFFLHGSLSLSLTTTEEVQTMFDRSLNVCANESLSVVVEDSHKNVFEVTLCLVLWDIFTIPNNIVGKLFVPQ